MDRTLGASGRHARACPRIVPLLGWLLGLAAIVTLMGGCAAPSVTRGGIPSPVPEADLRETLLADARYHVENVPPDFPPPRAASFRVAAQGVLAWKQGRVQEAEDRLEQSLTLDPRNPFGYFYLAEIRIRESAFSQALIFLDQAELHFQGHPHWLSEVYEGKGRCQEALGDLKAAVQAYARALEYNPWNESAEEGLARAGSPQG